MLDPLYHLAAGAIVFFHKGFGPIFGQESFFAWAFSVVLLVVCVRIVIFPLFVKQVKSQRTMQMLQPRIKEIREKYKNDKPRMQQEIMALQREHGNPLLGCLPIVLQIPLFISLFHVFNSLVPRKSAAGYHYVSTVGLSAHQVEQISSAKLFGVSLSSAFTSKDAVLKFLGADGAHVKIFAVVLIMLMGFTTFFTQKQIMGRTGPVDPQQERIQKILLYVSPLFLVIFGFRFPIAVLLYWLTTNLWSMGQQFFVIRRMPPVVAGSSGTLAASGGRPPAKPGRAAITPADGTGSSRPTGAKGKGTGERSGQPPRGTAAKGTAARGTAGAKGAAAPEKGTAAAKDGAPAKGARPNLSKNGSSAEVTPEQAAKNGSSSPPAADGDAAGGRAVGAGRPRQPSGDGTPRPPAPVAAGARRPAGNRPKKRGKGQRRGGRH